MEELKTAASKCHICDQEFLDHHDLKAHFLECDMEHKCEICENVFQTATLLENHKNFHDEVNKGPLKKKFHEDYNCKYCGKTFSSSQYLKKHICTVQDDHKDYKCGSTNHPNENIEENLVFIKEPKLEPKIEFDVKNASADHEVFS